MLPLGAWAGLALAGEGALAILLALFVRRAAPDTAPNRTLAFLLVAVGAYQVAYGAWSVQNWGLPWSSPEVRGGLRTVAVLLSAAVPLLYVLFVGHAVDSAWTRWLRRPAVVWALALAVAAFAALWLLRPERFMGGHEWAAGFYLGGVASLLALAGAVDSWRQATPGSSAQRQAAAFFVAFGVRDALFLAQLVQALAMDLAAREVLLGPRRWILEANFDLWLEALVSGLFLALLAFAVLTGQLVTVDNRIKATVRHAIVAAAVAAIFVSVSEALQEVLGIGNLGWGIASAVILAFAFDPLQRRAERLAAHLVPGARSLRGLAASDRLEVYREQVRVAWSDGRLLAKEGEMLERLREQLGLDAETAERVQAEMARA